MIRLMVLPPSEVLLLIPDPSARLVVVVSKRKVQRAKAKIGDYLLNMDSTRLQCFKQSLECCWCGIVGQFFAIERHNDQAQPHLNLYAMRDGFEVLMTRDHVLPLSKGGRDVPSNCRTMCCTCNWARGPANKGI